MPAQWLQALRRAAGGHEASAAPLPFAISDAIVWLTRVCDRRSSMLRSISRVSLSPSLRRRCRRAPMRSQTQPTVQVTASRVAETVDATLADVSVITRADIDASGARDVLDLLRLQAGVDLYRTGGAGPADLVVPARHQQQSRARADRRRARVVGRTPARSHSNGCRSTRSSASRSCADRARATGAPTRSAA